MRFHQGFILGFIQEFFLGLVQKFFPECLQKLLPRFLHYLHYGISWGILIWIHLAIFPEIPSGVLSGILFRNSTWNYCSNSTKNSFVSPKMLQGFFQAFSQDFSSQDLLMFFFSGTHPGIPAVLFLRNCSLEFFRNSSSDLSRNSFREFSRDKIRGLVRNCSENSFRNSIKIPADVSFWNFSKDSPRSFLLEFIQETLMFQEVSAALQGGMFHWVSFVIHEEPQGTVLAR